MITLVGDLPADTAVLLPGGWGLPFLTPAVHGILQHTFYPISLPDSQVRGSHQVGKSCCGSFWACKSLTLILDWLCTVHIFPSDLELEL